MKTVGIIAEYNPFHNGHLYHLNEAKKLAGADYAAVAMSGDFTQRGAPAIFDKYERTRMALAGGADLVVEMPVFGASASAADFARCGVSLLAQMGVVDAISFGSECGDLSLLETAAGGGFRETAALSARIRELLRAGNSYPAAAALARAERRPEGGPARERAPALPPNDILAVEYLRALTALRLPITPIPVRRCDDGYHSETLSGSFASATAVRGAYESGDLALLEKALPPFVFSELPNLFAVRPDDFSELLNRQILRLSATELNRYADMSKEIAAWLFKERLRFGVFTERIGQLKRRQYTYTRLSRALLHLSLEIRKEETERFKELASAPWIRILGFRRTALPLLSRLKKEAGVPIVAKVADAGRLLSPAAYALWEKNLYACELYRMVRQLKTGQSAKNEFTRSVLVMDSDLSRPPAASAGGRASAPPEKN